MHADDEISQPAEGEWFRIVRSAHHGGGPLQFVWEIQPGYSGPPEHIHPHDHEIFRVMAGRARVTLGGEVRVLSAGESVHMPKGVPHQVRAEGDEPLRAMVTYDDGYRFEFVLDAMAEQGFGGFAKMCQVVVDNPDVLVQTRWHIRAFLRVVGSAGWLLGHRYAGPRPTGRPAA